MEEARERGEEGGRWRWKEVEAASLALPYSCVEFTKPLFLDSFLSYVTFLRNGKEKGKEKEEKAATQLILTGKATKEPKFSPSKVLKRSYSAIGFNTRLVSSPSHLDEVDLRH